MKLNLPVHAMKIRIY